VDMRGFGDSDKPSSISEYKLDILVSDIKHLITELGLFSHPELYMLAKQCLNMLCFLEGYLAFYKPVNPKGSIPQQFRNKTG